MRTDIENRKDEVIDDTDFLEKDSNGEIVTNDDGESFQKDVMLKVNVPSSNASNVRYSLL